MTQTPLWLRDIESRSAGKQVLLVEGSKDVTLLGYFLTYHAPGWELRFVIEPAGGKQHVVSGVCVHRQDWIGVIDLDEWNPDDLERALARSPRLLRLPRFCIESYFCHPTEIWAALPSTQRTRVGNDPQVLAKPIMEALPDWVAHGAMWRVLRKLYHTARLPAQLERAPITDEVQIRTILQTWHDQLSPDLVLEQYHAELDAAKNLTQDEQLIAYVHGKKFYNQVVVQILDRLFGGKGADDWLQRLRDGNLHPSQDLTILLDQILHLTS